MSDATMAMPLTLAERIDQIFPTLTAAQIARVAGHVRSGNVKRVASAVGEGSIAVASVHQVLRE